MQDSFSRTTVDIALICILLLSFCARVWNHGIMHTDDAFWALWAYQPSAHPISDWATSQGRLWAFPAGILLLHALAWQGTVYGEVLRLGGFVVFFAAFYAFVAVYCGRRIAVLSACLFLALFALRWEGSALTAYPLITWAPGTLFLISVLFARAYFVSGKPAPLVAIGPCLFASLFTNEGVALLFCIIFPISLVGNVVASGNGRTLLSEFIGQSRTQRLAMIYVLTVASYLILAISWALLHPSHYQGHAVAPFDPLRIAAVLVDFTTSGSILHDFFRPYVVNFADAVSGGGLHAIYKPLCFVRTLIWYPQAWLVGFITVILLQRVLLDQVGGRKGKFRALELITLIFGFAIAFVPILPVAASTKYQDWYFDFGVGAYVQTILAHFGICLFLAGIVSIVFPVAVSSSRSGAILRIALTFGVGALATLSYRMNDAIAIDMRPESGRWRVLEQALEAVAAAQMDVVAIWAPRFRSGSWFTVVPISYWSDYAKARYNADIRFLEILPLPDALDGLTYLDYMLADDDRSFIVTLAHLRSLKSSDRSKAFVDRIAIHLERPSASRLRSYFLSFRDDKGSLQQIRLQDLQRKGPRVWALENIVAEPSSIRVIRQSVVGNVPIQCAESVRMNSIVQFGIGLDRGCVGTAYLKSGWGVPEQGGVWSLGQSARLSFRIADLQSGNLEVFFDLSTYVGLGFYEGTQTIRAGLKDRPLVTWTFTRGSPDPPAQFTIPEEFLDPRGYVDIIFEIMPRLNPKALGQNDDNRDLGIFLRSFRLGRMSR